MTLYLPTLEQQKRAVQIHHSLRALSLHIDELERQLWQRPTDVAQIEAALRELNEEKSFENWVERLPFPLASILWRYLASASAEAKTTHLLNFFEALGEFTACILLSGIRADRAFFEEHRGELIQRDARPLLRASFGTWVHLGQKIARICAPALASKERQRLVAIFRSNGPDLLEALCGDALHGVLDAVNRYRNDWKGHGGLEGPEEARRRLDLLEVELAKVREALATTFNDYDLVRPGDGRLRDGVWHYTAESLMGTRTTFRQVRLQTTEPMVEDRLYLMPGSVGRALELVPLFRIMPSPHEEANACYFYNRSDDGRSRFVSYHFEKESEVFLLDDQLPAVFSDLVRP